MSLGRAAGRRDEAVEARFRAIFDQSPNGIYVLDAQLRFTDLNTVAEQLIGERSATIGRTIAQIMERLWTAEVAEGAVVPFRDVLATGTPFKASAYRTERRDTKEQLYYDWELSRITMGDGSVFGLLCTFTDVTQHVRAGDEMTTLKEQFRHLADAVPQLMWSTDAAGKMSYVNQRWIDYTGLDLATARVTDWRGLVHPDDHETVMSTWKVSFERGEPYQVEYRTRRASDGAYRWHLVRGTPHRGADGAIAGWNGTNTDIHDLKVAAELLAESREQLRVMADAMPQKIFTATAAGEVDYFNEQWMEYTGLTFEQIRSWGWTQFVHPDDLDENIRLWQRSIDSGEDFLFEQRFRRVDGAYRWHLSRARAMRGASGAIVKWLGSNTDIDDQKRMRDELARSNADLEHFASVASHDIQEPLRMISSYVALLEKRAGDGLDDRSRQYLAHITGGAERLRLMVRALLTYASVGATVDAEPVPSMLVLREALDNLAEKISTSHATVTFDELPTVRADRVLLVLVFQNLLGNAIKFCRDGRAPGIHVSASSDERGITFAVADNGIGIPVAHQARVFGIFQRMHGQTEYPGTGIGLATCQKIIARHGGRIWVESTPDIGSTFSFMLPH